jgi:hypothetical protein
MPFLLLLMLLVPRTSAAAEGDAVRVVLTGPATPYASVRYAVEERRGAVSASVTKTFADDFGFREEVGLLTAGDFAALFADLEGLGAFALPSTSGKATQARYEVEVRRGGRRHAFTVHDPALLPDARYRQLVARVRAAVEASAGTIPFRDPLLLPNEAGLLTLQSRPRARVEIDGVAHGETTPLDALPLPAGTHTVRLVALDEPLERTYEVKVEAGKTTRLVVDLR